MGKLMALQKSLKAQGITIEVITSDIRRAGFGDTDDIIPLKKRGGGSTRIYGELNQRK
jgi:hypothetical protein